MKNMQSLLQRHGAADVFNLEAHTANFYSLLEHGSLRHLSTRTSYKAIFPSISKLVGDATWLLGLRRIGKPTICAQTKRVSSASPSSI